MKRKTLLSVLSRLVITQLRNIHSTSLCLSPRVNFFYGENGSGKTSILEAISLLGLGRSFRSHKTRSLINHQEGELRVFAEVNNANNTIPIGIEKSRSGASHIRVSGETVLSASVLAKQLPLQIINSDSFQLIDGAPSQRRQFLDWMVFHVKPEFTDLWKGLQKLLKQRNSLLRRDKIGYADLRPWDVELVRFSLKIHQLRLEIFEQFYHVFSELQGEFSGKECCVEMTYIRGWDLSRSFEEVLESDFERDYRDGYTHHGPQRADIKIQIEQKPALDILSRGQKKTLVCAMRIAQAVLYQQCTQQQCIFLIDDLLAELDREHSQRLAKWLNALNGQVLVTGVSRQDLINAWKTENITPFVFHVEHGGVELIAKTGSDDPKIT